MPAPYAIRVFGDPVLKRACSDIDVIDDTTHALAADMLRTMYDAKGVGLAGNQIGVQKRIFTYDDGTGPHTVINPTIVERSGEWTHDEGCLSVPGLFFSITRAQKVTLVGLGLDGNEVVIEAEDFLAKIFQHEVDHLDGHLLLSRLDDEQRKSAMKALRDRQMRAD